MPDFDTGHLFLTYLIPIKAGSPEGSRTSYEQRVRIELAELPPAHQTPATSKTKYNSPFSRNRRNHLARMFVLSDVIYNGRVAENPLLSAIKGVDTIDPLPVDSLNCAYLVFATDVDAIEKDGDPLPGQLDSAQQKKVRMAYAATLWETMEPEIRAIFANCFDFDGVRDGAAFGAYLERCHVETTMPFHDYYLKLPAFNHLPLKRLGLAVALPALVMGLALLARLFGMIDVAGINTLLLAVVAGLVTAGAAYLSIRYMNANGNKPLAPGEYDDLPSVLKALYTQQAFTAFATQHQTASPAELHAAFGSFLAEHQPSDRAGPTQKPGVISSAHKAG